MSSTTSEYNVTYTIPAPTSAWPVGAVTTVAAISVRSSLAASQPPTASGSVTADPTNPAGLVVLGLVALNIAVVDSGNRSSTYYPAGAAFQIANGGMPPSGTIPSVTISQPPSTTVQIQDLGTAGTRTSPQKLTFAVLLQNAAGCFGVLDPMISNNGAMD